MIIPNGTIEVVQVTGGGIDTTTGYPIPVQQTFGTPIPCQYYPKTMELDARVKDEPAVLSKYEILIYDNHNIGDCSIRLKDENGNVVGIYAVIRFEMIHAVGQEKILV